MKKLFFISFLLLFLITSTFAQNEPPRLEVSAGYSYLLYNGSNLQGLTGTVGYNLFRSEYASLALSGELTGLRDTVNGTHYGLFTYQGGPELSFGGNNRFYARALAGGARVSLTGYESLNGYAGTFGGGLKIGLRGGTYARFGADYFPTYFNNHIEHGTRVTIGFGFGR